MEESLRIKGFNQINNNNNRIRSISLSDSSLYSTPSKDSAKGEELKFVNDLKLKSQLQLFRNESVRFSRDLRKKQISYIMKDLMQKSESLQNSLSKLNDLVHEHIEDRDEEKVFRTICSPEDNTSHLEILDSLPIKNKEEIVPIKSTAAASASASASQIVASNTVYDIEDIDSHCPLSWLSNMKQTTDEIRNVLEKSHQRLNIPKAPNKVKANANETAKSKPMIIKSIFLNSKSYVGIFQSNNPNLINNKFQHDQDEVD